MHNIFKNPGVDKYAHLGIGGLICAMLSTVLNTQDGILDFHALLYALAASAVVFAISVFKEYFVDERFDWADIAFAMIGCALYTVALTVGILLFMASH